MTRSRTFPQGLLQLDTGVWAYMQPDGFFGLNNAGVVADADTSLLVDTLMDNPRTRAMLADMAAVHPAAADINLLVNTHSHCDHTGGNSLLPRAQRIMTTRAAAEFDRLRPEYFFGFLSKVNGDGKLLLTALLGDKFDLADASYAPPTRTFEGEIDLEVGRTAVQAIEVGAVHTSSDVIVHVPASGVVFAGDLMFSDSHFPLHGTELDKGISFFERMLAWDADKYVPGHGGMCDRSDVREHLDYLRFFRDESRRLFGMGIDAHQATLEFIGNLGPFSEYDRTDLVLHNMKIQYGLLAGTPTHLDLNETLGERYRFHEELRKRGLQSRN